MSIICPTVLADTPEKFSEQMAKVSFAPRIQIDLIDNFLTAAETINLNQVYFNDGQATDLHLMFQEPSRWLEMIIALKPYLVVFHAEANIADFQKLVEHIQKFGIKVGLAILPETTIQSQQEKIKIVDHVLIFAGQLGFMGGQADLAQTRKVQEIRQIKNDIEIGWDGGANDSNVAELSRAGIDVINVGSFIMKSENPAATHKKLAELAQESLTKS